MFEEMEMITTYERNCKRYAQITNIDTLLNIKSRLNGCYTLL